jgi:hypothetical protein
MEIRLAIFILMCGAVGIVMGEGRRPSYGRVPGFPGISHPQFARLRPLSTKPSNRPAMIGPETIGNGIRTGVSGNPVSGEDRNNN